MAFNVNEIRSQLTAGGARPNLFQVSMPFPGIAGADGPAAATKISFMCHGAQIPGSDMGTIEVPYFGRTVKIAGNRRFPEWTPTVFNDEDFVVYNAIQSWMNSLNAHAGNVRDPAAATSVSYAVDAQVEHYGKTGDIIKTVTMVNMWPSALAPIDLAWENNDALEEFTCTFQFDFWQAEGITS